MTTSSQDRPVNASSGHRAARRHMAYRREPGTYRAPADVQLVTVHGLVGSHGEPAPITVAFPLAVGGAGPRRVDAGGTRLRLRALHVMGHGSAGVARAAGASEQAIQKITRGQTGTVRPALRDAVAAVYDAWWDKRAPGRTRYERAAATAARRRAAAGNWCAGAGLDDDQLDVPGYQPAWGWLPAQGTGVAGDIRLPARSRQAGIA